MSVLGELHPLQDGVPKPFLDRALPPIVVRALALLLSLLAAFAGSVFALVKFPERVEGDFVLIAGEEHGALQAAIDVPESQAARLAVGDQVGLLLAAYPYTRYGARSARVRLVEGHFERGALRAYAELGTGGVVVDGTARPLRPGMRGVARVIVGSRTLLEYALEPLRQLRENLEE